MPTKGAVACGAKCHDGHSCLGPAMPNGRCRMHRGKAVKGMAHGSLTTGKYSKDLPTRLAKQYEQARDDPDLTNLRNEIGVAEARFRELLQKVEQGDLGTLWPELYKTKQALTLARTSRAAGPGQDPPDIGGERYSWRHHIPANLLQGMNHFVNLFYIQVYQDKALFTLGVFSRNKQATPTSVLYVIR